MGAVQFIENLDRTALTISDQDFERKVEQSVSSIAERNTAPVKASRGTDNTMGRVQVSEKSTISQPRVTASDTSTIQPGKLALREKPYISQNLTASDENTAVDGLLKTMKRPLSSLGKIFSDDEGNSQPPDQQLVAPEQAISRLSPDIFKPPRHSDEAERRGQGGEDQSDNSPLMRKLRTEDAAAAAARQASAEAAQAERIQQAEHQNVVE